MKTAIVSVLSALACCGTAAAQSSNSPPPRFEAGLPLGVVKDGRNEATSANVRVFGAFANAESCIFDKTRNLIIVPSRGAAQNEVPNDGYVSLIHSDGTVHTVRWIGANRAGLVLNQPMGSDIHAGRLYLADIDGGTADGAARVSVVRMFDLKTGAPAGDVRIPGSPGFNDIAVASDGTLYGTQTGGGDVPMKVWKITPDGVASVFLEGPLLKSPNGVAIDKEGSIVVLNMGSDEVLTFSPQGQLLKTEHAAMAGSDGIVIMPDGTKYISSVMLGGVSRIRPGRPAELIASGIPSAASMCYDPVARQLVIPMNRNNALAFVKID